MRFRGGVFGAWGALLAAVSLGGCAGENGGPRGSSPVPTAPALTSSKPTEPKAAPLPQLPPGAGPMDENAPEELTPTESGLLYRVLREGNDTKPRPIDTVVVNYKGWLDNGKMFDSSYGKGAPLTSRLDALVPGWIEGIRLIGEGGMIELEIPGELGYGARGFPPVIPPNATLHFIVELLEVQPSER